MIKSINRPDLAKRFAKDLGITYKQTEEIMEETERVLRRMLNEREQVRIHGFGTFYVTTIRSHVIKQIRTKTPRIVLEQRSVKFRPSPIFKDQIYDRSPKPKTTAKPAEAREQVKVEIKPEIKIETPKIKREEIKPPVTPAKPPTPTVQFKPVAIHPRVEKEKIKNKILERWLNLARRSKQEGQTPSEIAREALIVGGLLKQIKKAGYESVSFTYSQDKYINIYAGKPRRQLSHLSREIVGGFLDFVDIKEFHLPQERRVIITLDKLRADRLNLHIHSFPIENGSSIKISIAGNA